MTPVGIGIRLVLMTAVVVVGATSLSWAQKPKRAAAPPKPAAAAEQPPLPAAPDANMPDLAYGAFQRGYYMTAFSLATKRADENKDPKAMTLLGELYSHGWGVGQSDQKAAEWYQLAAARGDREATFALAMFRLTGRAGKQDRPVGAQLLASAAKLGSIPAAYDLGLLYLEGQLFPQDFQHAAKLFRQAADDGGPEAQYALATMYREGRGVTKDPAEAVRLLASAAQADNLDAMIEYAIALYNGESVTKNEAGAAELLMKAAKRGSPIAQNRVARILATGRGLPADPVQATKWHLIARAGGDGDIWMDGFMQKLTPAQRADAEKSAKPWIAVITAANEARPSAPASQPRP